VGTIGDFFRKYDGVRVDRIAEAEQEDYVRRTWAARDARRRLAEEGAMAVELRERGVYLLAGGRLIAGEGHDGGWVLYTPQEWEAAVTADTEVQADGSITFQGEPAGYTVDDLQDTGETADD